MTKPKTPKGRDDPFDPAMPGTREEAALREIWLVSADAFTERTERKPGRKEPDFDELAARLQRPEIERRD
jgi:hypothetical protein